MPIQTGLPERLTWIDDANRSEHSFLIREDRCAFFGELQASTGWGGGATNQLIANFKRSPAQIGHEPGGERLRRHRERAINEVAAALRSQFTREEVELRCTFVPIPTSKQPGHPEYCDRLERSLRLAFAGYRADIRPLLRLTASARPDHLSADERLRYQHLLAMTLVDPRQLAGEPRPVVVLFDDVLTSGKHFKVAKTRIREVFPGQGILGIFVARRALSSPGHPRPGVNLNCDAGASASSDPSRPQREQLQGPRN
jgi:hypothetical protein